MLPPAAEALAAAAAEIRLAAGAGAAFLGDEDDLDDSEEDEEEVETDDLDDEDVDDDEDELDRKLPAASAVAPVAVSVGMLNGSTPSTSSASYPIPAAASKIPNPNGNPAAVMGNSNPTPSLSSAAGVIRAVQAIVVAGGEGALDGPDRKRQRTGAAPAAGGGAVTVAAEEKKPLAVLEDSRRLFQRLFTDEDEITILQGFLHFNSQRNSAGANHAHHHDTGPFYDQIRTRLQLDFNKNQLVEKLRRLKKKYRNIMNKMSSGKDYAFKSPHDQATFELSRKIWGSGIYSRGGGAGPGPDDDDDDDPTPHPQIVGNDQGTLMGNSDRRRIRRRGRRRSIAAAAAASEALLMTPEAPVEVKVAESHMPSAMASVPNVIEETVRCCLSPLFKELLYCAVGGPVGPGANSGGLGGLGLSPFPLTVGNNLVNLPNVATIDDKWRRQQILELEVYSKRIELVQEQIKLMLEELRK